MLSYQQYLSRHATKFSGLSRAEKQRRYQDYVRSQRNTTTAQPKRRRRRQAARTLTTASSNGAIRKYFNLFANPFTADAVGLPVFPSPPTTKVTSWYRGTLNIGTAGIGLIYGSPVAANDSVNWFYSPASFTGTKFLSSGTTGFTPTNLPFTIAQITDPSGIRHRCVCAAIRVRYIGKETDLGGVIYPFLHPTHSLVSNFGQQEMSAFEESYVSVPVSRQWTTLVWSPIHRTELEFTDTQGIPAHYDLHTLADKHMGIMIAAAPTLGFEFEVVQHHEFMGQGLGMTRTENQVTESAESYLPKLQRPSNSVRTTGVRASLAILGGLAAGIIMNT
jgi:hypothetical protein